MKSIIVIGFALIAVAWIVVIVVEIDKKVNNN
jgi:hypothetical protein